MVVHKKDKKNHWKRKKNLEKIIFTKSYATGRITGNRKERNAKRKLESKKFFRKELS